MLAAMTGIKLVRHAEGMIELSDGSVHSCGQQALDGWFQGDPACYSGGLLVNGRTNQAVVATRLA